MNQRGENTVIIGSFSGHNHGDMLILKALVQKLKREGATVYAPSRKPGSLSKLTKEMVIPLPVEMTEDKGGKINSKAEISKSTLSKIGSMDRAIVTAGVLYKSTVGLYKDYFDVLFENGIKINCLCVGIDKLIDQARKVLQASDFISVRDSASYAKLKEEGFEVTLAADVAHIMIDRLATGKALALNVRSGGNISSDFMLKEMSKVAGDFERTLIIETAAADKKLSKMLAAKVVNSEHYFGLVNPINYFEQCGFAITTRFHATLIATSMGIPTAAIPYHVKVSDYMKDIGMEEYIVWNPESLRGIIKKVKQAGPEVREHLLQMARVRAEKARQGLEEQSE